MNRLAKVSAIVAALAVLAGAMGAHYLKDQFEAVDAEKAAGWWATGAQYHLVHAVALFAIAATRNRRLAAAWWTILAGIVLFSGSLYLMAVTGSKALPVVLATPMGGLLLIAGWIVAAVRFRTGGD